MSSNPHSLRRSGFLVELYVDSVAAADVEGICAPARSAAHRSSQPAVAYVQSIIIPTDETCFHVFEAISGEAVEAALTASGIRYDRINQAWLVDTSEAGGLLHLPPAQEDAG